MQKSRRRRGLEFNLLSLVGATLAACASTPAPSTPPAPSASEASSAFSPPHAPVADPSTSQAPPASMAEPSENSAPMPKGTRVLQIGDSFADALGGKLSPLLRAAEVKTSLEFETPSYIPNWSYGTKLQKLLSNYRPDLVLITLGANEIEIPHPEERIKPVRHLVQTLAGRPCVWIAPPLWKPDSGVLQVIRDNVAPCRYLDSNQLVHDLPRARDKIHPSMAGREIWAKVVFDWLVRERVGTAEQPWALRPEAGESASSETTRAER
ncbi:MAG TPA: SGNH/GDSL hydrolase family protein [Polyangiaceae bacterium]|nr:SGNH/GDSL hydrolase family protein [Polyangiaceae bacterium]